MKTAIYTRLSKDRTGLSENCAIQLKECRAYLADHGWTEVLALEENDTSASRYSTKPRPQYEHLLAAIEHSDIQVILVTEMTRLYRRMPELLKLITLSEETPLRRIETTDGISYDLSTPEGAHAARAAVNNAILESDKLSKRLLRKKTARASEGRYLGGYRAYGYEGAKHDDQGNLINKGRINIAFVPEEVEVYRTCIQRLIAGERSTTIIRDMNDNGIPSPAGKLWTVGNFKRTITRKRYVIFDPDDPEQRGTLEHHGREYRAVWPGLISRETYEFMMARYAQTAQPWAHGLAHGRSYLLSGFIYCSCGNHMIGSARRLPDGSQQRRYRCRTFDNHLQAVGCGKLFRSAEAVDLYIINSVLAKLDTDEVIQALSEQEESIEANELFTKLSNLQQHRKDIIADFGHGEISKTDFRALLQAADDAIASAQAQLAKYTQSRTNNIAGNSDELKKVFESGSIELQASVIKLVVDKIVLHPAKPVGSALWNGYRFRPESVEIVYKPFANLSTLQLVSLIKAYRSAFALAA